MWSTPYRHDHIHFINNEAITITSNVNGSQYFVVIRTNEVRQDCFESALWPRDWLWCNNGFATWYRCNNRQ